MEFSRPEYWSRWVAFPFSRGSSQPRNQTRISCIAGGFFTRWAIRESHGKAKGNRVELSTVNGGAYQGLLTWTVLCIPPSPEMRMLPPFRCREDASHNRVLWSASGEEEGVRVLRVLSMTFFRDERKSECPSSMCQFSNSFRLKYSTRWGAIFGRSMLLTCPLYPIPCLLGLGMCLGLASVYNIELNLLLSLLSPEIFRHFLVPEGPGSSSGSSDQEDVFLPLKSCTLLSDSICPWAESAREGREEEVTGILPTCFGPQWPLFLVPPGQRERFSSWSPVYPGLCGCCEAPTTSVQLQGWDCPQGRSGWGKDKLPKYPSCSF